MDIKQLHTAEAHEEGAEMRVKDQHGKDTDIYIKLVGVDSKLWRDIAKKRNRKFIAEVASKGKKTESDEDGRFEDIASAIIDWRGAKSGGKAYKYSKKAALELFKNAPYIADQCDAFIAKRANFTGS